MLLFRQGIDIFSKSGTLFFGFFFHLLFLIKAQLQDRYKQYDIINYANLITNTNYKIITNLQTLSTNSNYKFTLHYIRSQLDLIKDVVKNIKPNNMYRYFISVYTTLNATIYPIPDRNIVNLQEIVDLHFSWIMDFFGLFIVC